MTAPAAVDRVPARLRPLLLVTATAALLLLAGTLARVALAPTPATASGGPVTVEVPDGWIVSSPTDRHAVLGMRTVGQSPRITLSVVPGPDAAAVAAERTTQVAERTTLHTSLGDGEVTAAGRSWYAVEYVHVVPEPIPVAMRARVFYTAIDGGVLEVLYTASSDEFDGSIPALAGVLDSLTIGGAP